MRLHDGSIFAAANTLDKTLRAAEKLCRGRFEKHSQIGPTLTKMRGDVKDLNKKSKDWRAARGKIIDGAEHLINA